MTDLAARLVRDTLDVPAIADVRTAARDALAPEVLARRRESERRYLAPSRAAPGKWLAAHSPVFANLRGGGH